MTTTAILGPEHDSAVTNALLSVLREMGATERSRNWGMAGSQEVNTLNFTVNGHPLAVEAETYVGLSVTGERETVETIAARVRDMMGN